MLQFDLFFFLGYLIQFLGLFELSWGCFSGKIVGEISSKRYSIYIDDGGHPQMMLFFYGEGSFKTCKSKCYKRRGKPNIIL